MGEGVEYVTHVRPGGAFFKLESYIYTVYPWINLKNVYQYYQEMQYVFSEEGPLGLRIDKTGTVTSVQPDSRPGQLT